MNILIIEDNAETLESLNMSLRDEGFVVDMACDGEAGLRKAINNKYDIIVLDIGLPRKSGKEICAKLRALGKNMPIIILSVKGEVETKVDLLKIGADDFLAKPFAFQELLARINALLRRPSNMQGDALEIDDLTIDMTGHIVRRGEEEVHLTLKEFALLEYFMRNRGRVLSREEILEHVWDVNADPFTNTIETHILNIRKKIGPRGRGKFIRTVPGIGYKMD